MYLYFLSVTFFLYFYHLLSLHLSVYVTPRQAVICQTTYVFIPLPFSTLPRSLLLFSTVLILDVSRHALLFVIQLSLLWTINIPLHEVEQHTYNHTSVLTHFPLNFLYTSTQSFFCLQSLFYLSLYLPFVSSVHSSSLTPLVLLPSLLLP
jgi:hypothetical protein